ncbi:hypothetical protein P8452_28260 [Trifolium repens]|nr:hypothetical protein P8452_28260 [Trifolium repens]
MFPVLIHAFVNTSLLLPRTQMIAAQRTTVMMMENSKSTTTTAVHALSNLFYFTDKLIRQPISFYFISINTTCCNETFPLRLGKVLKLFRSIVQLSNDSEKDVI